MTYKSTMLLLGLVFIHPLTGCCEEVSAMGNSGGREPVQMSVVDSVAGLSPDDSGVREGGRVDGSLDGRDVVSAACTDDVCTLLPASELLASNEADDGGGCTTTTIEIETPIIDIDIKHDSCPAEPNATLRSAAENAALACMYVPEDDWCPNPPWPVPPCPPCPPEPPYPPDLPYDRAGA